MHLNCYTCDSCFTHFAIHSLDDMGDPTCPSCGGETTDTNEVIVNPKIMGYTSAKEHGHI